MYHNRGIPQIQNVKAAFVDYYCYNRLIAENKCSQYYQDLYQVAA